ncbi:hypothetical protein AAEX28_14080 [Lentisphaerota bacterium WC36G]|nr:hypothetical protein LJT99_00830 [Lentisphaerae bacterium WC36]
MNTVSIIAQLIGWTFLTAGLGMLVSRKHYKELFANMGKVSPVLLFLAGFIELPLGVAIVMLTYGICYHVALVTMIIGLLFIAEGFSVLVMPDRYLKLWTKIRSCSFCVGVILLILGAYLIIFA